MGKQLHIACFKLSPLWWLFLGFRAGSLKGRKLANTKKELSFPLQETESADVGAGTDMAAQESSKLEECQAICKLRGVAPNAPIALQLKAIDEEFKSLRNSGQSGRADHVQGLYAWRTKQALMVKAIVFGFLTLSKLSLAYKSVRRHYFF